MNSGRLQAGWALSAVLVVVPGVATAQGVDPTVVADAPASLRAVASFVLVGLFGGGLLTLYGDRVDRAIDESLDSSPLTVVYGLMAFVVVGFFGTYAYTFLVGLAAGDNIVSTASLVLFGALFLSLAAFGYLVVGTLLTDLYGSRRPWYGLALGAAASAVSWLLLPVAGAVLAWVAVAAIGVGGPARAWLYASRREEAPGAA